MNIIIDKEIDYTDHEERKILNFLDRLQLSYNIKNIDYLYLYNVLMDRVKIIESDDFIITFYICGHRGYGQTIGQFEDKIVSWKIQRNAII